MYTETAKTCNYLTVDLCMIYQIEYIFFKYWPGWPTTGKKDWFNLRKRGKHRLPDSPPRDTQPGVIDIELDKEPCQYTLCGDMSIHVASRACWICWNTPGHLENPDIPSYAPPTQEYEWKGFQLWSPDPQRTQENRSKGLHSRSTDTRRTGTELRTYNCVNRYNLRPRSTKGHRQRKLTIRTRRNKFKERMNRLRRCKDLLVSFDINQSYYWHLIRREPLPIQGKMIRAISVV